MNSNDFPCDSLDKDLKTGPSGDTSTQEATGALWGPLA